MEELKNIGALHRSLSLIAITPNLPDAGGYLATQWLFIAVCFGFFY